MTFVGVGSASTVRSKPESLKSLGVDEWVVVRQGHVVLLFVVRHNQYYLRDAAQG